MKIRNRLMAILLVLVLACFVFSCGGGGGGSDGGDTTPPVITLNGANPMTLVVGQPYNEPGATMLDDRDGNISNRVGITGEVNINAAGTYARTYNGSDLSGNAASPVTRTVNVVNTPPPPDTTPPVITLNGANPMTLVVGQPYNEPGATMLDDRDGNISNRVGITGEVNINAAGTYARTYNGSDLSGNAASPVTRTVNVVNTPPPPDTTPPVITVLGANPVSVAVGAVYNDTNATAVDAVDGNITNHITTTGLPVDTSTPGSHTITYRVSDAAGNLASATRTVNVVNTPPPPDTTPPVITLNGANPMTLVVGQPYNEPGATMLDDRDGNISNRVGITGEVNINAAGTYARTYNGSDLSGNAASPVTRTVNVVPVPLWVIPDGYNFYFIATDGNLVIRTGYKVTSGNFLAAMTCYNSDGTTRWTKELSYEDYSTSKSVIANGNLYVIRSVGVFSPGWVIPASYDIYIDRFDLADGTPIGSLYFVGNTSDYASIAADSTSIFVSLNYANWTADVFKIDFSLSFKSTVLTFPGDIRNMAISGGNLGIAAQVLSLDGLGNSDAAAMVYTTAGIPVWASPKTYTPLAGTFNYGNAVKFRGSEVWLTGATMTLPPILGPNSPFLRKYSLVSGNFVSHTALTSGEGWAWGMTLDPSGNVYVAMSSGAMGPIALNPGGQALWTGPEEEWSLEYFQGKIITPEAVYDATTGQKLF